MVVAMTNKSAARSADACCNEAGEEECTQEHLDEQVAVCIPGEAVPAVHQVVGRVQDDAWVTIFPTHMQLCDLLLQ